MNINQYMCNMNVLAGLFLANNTSLNVSLHRGDRSGEDMIDFLGHTDPLMDFHLLIYFKDGYIELHIISDPTIYMQVKKYNPNTRTFAGPILILIL